MEVMFIFVNLNYELSIYINLSVSFITTKKRAVEHN